MFQITVSLKLFKSLQPPTPPRCHLQARHFSVSSLSFQVSRPTRRGSRTMELVVHRAPDKAKASNTTSSSGCAPEALEWHLQVSVGFSAKVL